MNSIELSLFSSRIEAVCEEMGAVLRRVAFSPNIKDRLDFSCAVFDPEGELCAQAAHIPVHLGSMAFAMKDIVGQFEWQSGDMVVLNDPYKGGTHLPDVTVIAPVIIDGNLSGFVANRAHHADIGADSPGSMPLSTSLEEEGLVISPRYLVHSGEVDQEFLELLGNSVKNRAAAFGDFYAQISTCNRGLLRLEKLIGQMGRENYLDGLVELNAYGERLAKNVLSRFEEGVFTFEDVMDSDGKSECPIKICLKLTVSSEQLKVDFTGTDSQVEGNINCPLSVAAAAVYYLFRCLLPENAPACAGLFRPVEIFAPQGSLLNAAFPAAVAAGNVETSTRVVDVMMGALAKVLPDEMPAASHGSMNNLAMGSRASEGSWDYYETIGGGMGASSQHDGLAAVQTHMTNTLNTPVEVIESVYPLQICRYEIRKESGGKGVHRGGDGLIREYLFTRPAEATILSERRSSVPWGAKGGASGKEGRNLLNGEMVPAKVKLSLQAGDRLTIETAGGGGWGEV